MLSLHVFDSRNIFDFAICKSTNFNSLKKKLHFFHDSLGKYFDGGRIFCGFTKIYEITSDGKVVVNEKFFDLKNLGVQKK